MGDSQDHQDDVRDEFVVPEEFPSSEEPLAVPPEPEPEPEQPGVLLPPDAVAPEVPHDPEIADVVASLDDDEPQTTELDPEIAALQADLESDPDPTDTVDSDEGTVSSPAAVDPELGTADAGEPETAEPADDETPSDSLGDIAPGTVAGAEAAAQDSADIGMPADRAGIPLWPYLVYFGLWLVFAAVLVWQAMLVPAGTPIYELDLYGFSILAGMVLTALGPLLAIGVWLAAWLAHPNARKGLFSRAFIIGAVTTLAGVLVWLIALGALDMLRLGRAF